MMATLGSEYTVLSSRSWWFALLVLWDCVPGRQYGQGQLSVHAEVEILIALVAVGCCEHCRQCRHVNLFNIIIVIHCRYGLSQFFKILSLSLTFTARLVGPTLGFLLGSACLGTYVYPGMEVITILIIVISIIILACFSLPKLCIRDIS